MSYAPYDYYRATFEGTVIPTEVDYHDVEVEATAYIDHITRGRITLTDETPAAIRTAVQNAACSVAEVIYKQAHDEATVSSESVGNHSITYSSSKPEREAEKRRKASLYLSRTGLLYGGMK